MFGTSNIGTVPRFCASVKGVLRHLFCRSRTSPRKFKAPFCNNQDNIGSRNESLVCSSGVLICKNNTHVSKLMSFLYFFRFDEILCHSNGILQFMTVISCIDTSAVSTRISISSNETGSNLIKVHILSVMRGQTFQVSASCYRNRLPTTSGTKITRISLNICHERHSKYF